jgi:ankyrin repeat protein
VCQLHALRQCRRARDIQKALTQLPATLDETYERILRNLDTEYQSEARAILCWLASSKRTLTLLELGEAAVIQPADRQFDLEARFSDASEVLRIFGSLITYSTATNHQDQEVIRFAHYSVQEYLLSGRSITFPINIENSQQHVTRSCLLYLNHLKSVPEECLHQYPLLNYAASYWFQHLWRANETDPLTMEFACNLLAKDYTTHAPKWLSIYEPCTELHGRRKLQQTLRYPGALYYAVCLNLLQAVAALLETGVNINELHGFGTQDNSPCAALTSVYGIRINLSQRQTALHLAVFLGFQPMVELLLELGADPNVKASFGSPPLTSSGRSRLEREDSREQSCESALGDAVHQNEPDMVRILLDHGAQTDVICKGYPVLIYAARYGSWDIVSHLLSAGVEPEVTDEVSKPWHYPTALLLACSQGSTAGVRDLIHAGARVNCTDTAYTPLQVICCPESHTLIPQSPFQARLRMPSEPGNRHSLDLAQSLKICEILLESGADPNLVGHNVTRGTPLSEAAKRDNRTLMALLVDHGANCNGAPHADSMTPLATAAAQGHLSATKLLLSLGANVNFSPYDTSPAPLTLAASRGDLEIVQSLLEAGAHINAYCKVVLEEPLSYAMLAAASGGRGDVVRLLLDRGASVLPPTSQHQHAITAAACKGFNLVVEMLLQAGRDMDAEGCIRQAAEKICWHSVRKSKDTGTSTLALSGQYAQRSLYYQTSPVGCDKIVRALVNADGCLQQAAQNNHWDTVCFLLDAGADINAPGAILSTFPTVMYSAARAGRSDMVQLFLKAGIDPTRGDDGKTPLQAALRHGHTEIVRLLSGYKADYAPSVAAYIEIRNLMLERRKAREAQNEQRVEQ